MPVSAWGYVLDLFKELEPNSYYKIVPTERAGCEAVVAFLIGVLPIAISKLPIRANIE
ncbi:Uncharacterised protein [BD1-7 clade bacterium]|uniref:Uncharacterized protein n=1 Tax=BD1-7 clade bacterium TaxID=2029982 RepID=A0A5S9Q917_9GAMM|nr:Uncharacterised protein [BD1-7 clade bacterium]